MVTDSVGRKWTLAGGWRAIFFAKTSFAGYSHSIVAGGFELMS
jgi:hypothetical protein